MQVDAVLERYGPPASVEIPAWLIESRGRIGEAVGLLLGSQERHLAERWWWNDDRSGGAEARYAFFRAIETLESAAPAATRAVGEPQLHPAAQGAFAAATAARWDLHGLLVSLPDAVLDRDPGGGEWTVRQTLAHTVNVQRAYPSFSAWWLSREQTPDLPASVSDDVGIGFPEEGEEGVGSILTIRARLDAAMDGAAERLATLDATQLAIPARWAGYAVDVGFRMWRQSSHLQEHTVQVEKTLVMLDHAPRETDRLARLILRAYGRLEAVAYALPEALAEHGREPIIAAVESVAQVAAHVRQAGSVAIGDEG